MNIVRISAHVLRVQCWQDSVLAGLTTGDRSAHAVSIAEACTKHFISGPRPRRVGPDVTYHLRGSASMARAYKPQAAIVSTKVHLVCAARGPTTEGKQRKGPHHHSHANTLVAYLDDIVYIHDLQPGCTGSNKVLPSALYLVICLHRDLQTLSDR